MVNNKQGREKKQEVMKKVEREMLVLVMLCMYLWMRIYKMHIINIKKKTDLKNIGILIHTNESQSAFPVANIPYPSIDWWKKYNIKTNVLMQTAIWLKTSRAIRLFRKKILWLFPANRYTRFILPCPKLFFLIRRLPRVLCKFADLNWSVLLSFSAKIH